MINWIMLHNFGLKHLAKVIPLVYRRKNICIYIRKRVEDALRVSPVSFCKNVEKLKTFLLYQTLDNIYRWAFHLNETI